MVRPVGTLQILDRGVLGVGVIGTECRRSSGSELVTTSEYPWMPCARQRSDRSGTAPDSRRRWVRSREYLVGTVRLRICDHCLTYLIPQIHATDHIAWECHAGENA